MSLAARHLEANGVATVVLGCARDIVETCGVARFVFSDFPLGNSCGKPNDPTSQRGIVDIALETLASARRPRTTVQTPYRWSDDPAWKRDFYRLDLTPEQIAAAKAEFDSQKAILAAKLDATPGARA